MVRAPIVADRFYPGDPRLLKDYLSQVMVGQGMPKDALAVLAPHAGYVYSGAVAGRVFSSVQVPRTVLLLGPNHTGRGTPASIMSEGLWRTPLGDVEIDTGLAARLKIGCPHLEEDSQAHDYEHSLEVMLPFLQYVNPAVKIVPIAFMLRTLSMIEEVGISIGKTLRQAGQPVLIVVSSDMNHYESAEIGKKKDSKALDRLLNLDPEGLWRVVGQEKISMCGVIPAAVMLYAAKELGATAAELVEYTNSGAVSGDFDSVVGYAGAIVT